MKNKSLLLTLLIIFTGSILGAWLIYWIDEKTSLAAFIGWVILLAAPQIALLPAYKNVSCRFWKTADK